MTLRKLKIPHSKRTSRRAQAFTVYLGVVFLVALIGASWLPRSCPLLRQAFAPCPVEQIANAPVTSSDLDIARVPHQVVDRNLVEFNVRAQEYRRTTDVKFLYRGDLSKAMGYLAIRTLNGPDQTPDKNKVYSDPSTGGGTNTSIKRLALITHPLLYNLTWQRYSVAQPNQSMYQRNPTYATIDDLKANLPPAKQLAVDSIVAQQWNLDVHQYTLLDELKSLDGINYIVTSYSPPNPDGGWQSYNQTFDTQNAYVDTSGQLDWLLVMANVTDGNTPFLLSSVSVDYRSLQ